MAYFECFCLKMCRSHWFLATKHDFQAVFNSAIMQLLCPKQMTLSEMKNKREKKNADDRLRHVRRMKKMCCHQKHLAAQLVVKTAIYKCDVCYLIYKAAWFGCGWSQLNLIQRKWSEFASIWPICVSGGRLNRFQSKSNNYSMRQWQNAIIYAVDKSRRMIFLKHVDKLKSIVLGMEPIFLEACKWAIYWLQKSLDTEITSWSNEPLCQRLVWFQDKAIKIASNLDFL